MWVFLKVIELMVVVVKGCAASKQHLVAGELGACGIVAAANAVVTAVLVPTIEDPRARIPGAFDSLPPCPFLREKHVITDLGFWVLEERRHRTALQRGCIGGVHTGELSDLACQVDSGGKRMSSRCRPCDSGSHDVQGNSHGLLVIPGTF